MDQIEKYIEELMEKSTPDRPIWNILTLTGGQGLSYRKAVKAKPRRNYGEIESIFYIF